MRGLISAGASVWSLAFSPDGRTLAVGVDREGVRLFDVATRREERLLPGYFGCRNGVAFHPDGRLIATARAAHGVGVWDARTGQLRDQIRTPCYVPSVAFSPGGRLLAIWAGANNDLDMVLWDVESSQRHALLVGKSDTNHVPSFTTDGRFLAWLNAHENTVRVWDATTGAFKCRLEWAGFGPSGMLFADDGSQMILRRVGSPMDGWPGELLGLNEEPVGAPAPP